MAPMTMSPFAAWLISFTDWRTAMLTIAENSTLDNVRQRALRSEAAWRAMAERVQRGDAMRDTIAAEHAARKDAVA